MGEEEGEATHGINRKKAADLCVCRPALPEPGCEAAAEVRGGREETNGDPQEAARGAGEE